MGPLIRNSTLEIIKECKTANEIVQKLTTTYQRRGIASQLLLRKKLLTLKHAEEEQLDTFFITYDKLVRELKESDAKPSESEVICYLLLAMPKSYDTVVTAIEAISSDKISLEFVKNRLIEEEIKRKGLQERSVENSQAFFNKNLPYQKRKFNFECYNCGKKGHRKSECKFKPKKSQFKNRTNQKEANVVEEEGICFMVNKKNVTNDEVGQFIHFYADSGATDHLVNTDRFFDQYVDLKEPIKINVAKKEEILVATKIGVILTEECKLTNVLYVPNLRTNLLSINKIEKAGFGVKFENNKVYIYKCAKIIKEGYKKNNLFVFAFKLKEYTAQKAYSLPMSDEIWHKRLGHISLEKMKELKKRKFIECEISKDYLLCEPYVLKVDKQDCHSTIKNMNNREEY